MPGTIEPAAVAEQAPPTNEKFLVMNQEVDLDINFRDRSTTGTVRMTIFPLSNQLEAVHIDARQMDIDLSNVTVNEKKAKAAYHDPYDNLDVPSQLDWDASQYPYQQARLAPLLSRHDGELPAESRENGGLGCAPAYGSLTIWLRSDEPKPPPTKVKVRVVGSVAPRDPTPEQASHFEISIPFRSKSIRDGLHFVGIEESDTRYPHMYTIHSGQPGLASCIFPCIDDPGSRSYWTVRLRVPRTLGDALRQPLLTRRSATAALSAEESRPTVPMTEEDKLRDLTVVCAGTLVGEVIDKADESKKVMTFEMRTKQISALHVGFAVGPFVHVDLWSGFRDEADDDRLGDEAIKVHGYCLPGRDEEVRHSSAALTQAADFFATKFGKFPFESYKLCFVDDMVADTMPLCALSLCSSRLLYPLDLLDTEVDVMRKLIQALASQYFGVHIIANTRLDAWIPIGLSHFITDLFMGTLCGNNDYRFRMKTQADRLVEEDIDRLPLDELGNYLHLGDHQRDFMALKAPLVLFILDRRLTKRAAHNGLRRVLSKIVAQAEYTARDSARVVSSQSFRKLCERISHNSASLESFWQHWIHSSGCARFEMSHRYNKKHSRIDMTVRQPEERKDLPPPVLTKENFWGVLQERRHVPRTKKDSISVWFTGPITIGIHEANGTPYEHVAEIRRLGPRSFRPLEMPYNTKYKRLKRTRRQRERAMATAAQAEANGEAAEDAVLYSFGDVLQSAEDVEAWQIADWTPEQEKMMEQDSFEWLRLDADFEWLCAIRSNMQPWMYVSQLQQDRDVVAQQESVLYLSQRPGSDIAASFLAKTVMDTRYFHGIRTQAVRALQRQVWTRDEEVTDRETGQTTRLKVTVLGGLDHLMRAFRRFFCFPGTQTPMHNNFKNKMQYMVQREIPGAIARVRDNGRCPPEAQRFLLEQLRFNNNSDNDFSDHFYVAELLDALATSLVPEPTGDALRAPRRGDDAAASDERDFLVAALSEIERYARMDEWAHSYQNIWTTTALGCKQKLMKAGVIPVAGVEFVQYLQDGTLDVVQIKAFEALVDLGFLLTKGVLRLMLAFMTTHPSPFVRDRLFKVFCSGVAGLAFGEHDGLGARPRLRARSDAMHDDVDGDVAMATDGDEAELDGEGDDVLMMDNADAIIQRKKAEEARRSTIEGATQALRQEIRRVEDKELLLEIWRAVRSPVIGLVEQRNLLDLCQTLFEPDYSCRITVKHPMRWTAERVPPKPGQRHPQHPVILFKSVPRAAGPRPRPLPGEAPAPNDGAQPGAAEVAEPVVAGTLNATVVPLVTPEPATPVVGPIPPVQRQSAGIIKIKLGKLIQQPRQQNAIASAPGSQTTVHAAGSRPSTIALAPKTPSADSSSIAVLPSMSGSEPNIPRPEPPATSPATTVSTPKRSPKSKKRKREDVNAGSETPGRPRKYLVSLKCPRYIDRLRPETQEQIRAAAEESRAASSRPVPLTLASKDKTTISASPAARRPLPSGSSSGTPPQTASSIPKTRKPLPSAAPAGPTAVRPQMQPQAVAAGTLGASPTPPKPVVPRIKLITKKPA